MNDEIRYARSIKRGRVDVPFGEDLQRGVLRLMLEHGDELQEGIVIDCGIGTGSAGPGGTPGSHNYDHMQFGIKIVRDY